MGVASHIVRIGFLGIDSETRELLRAVATGRSCIVVGLADVDAESLATLDSDLRAVVTRARSFDAWESLLDQQQVDAVIVSRSADQDRRAEQLRKLIQVGVPSLAAHPVVESMLIYYELDMIRRDTGAIVIPYLPMRHHPAVERLQQWADPAGEQPLGRIEQVIVERALADSTREEVARQFARDVDLIRALAGDMTRLGAMDASGPESSYASLGVQMSGPRGIAARWSLDPVCGSRSARVRLLGTQGSATATFGELDRSAEVEIRIGEVIKIEPFDDPNRAERALERLRGALNGAAVVPDWIDAARDVELAETIPRSLAKSRTIELYYEDYTEEGTFKGTMTSVGCGLLILGLFLLGVVAIAEQLGVPYVRQWPKVLAAILGLFLLLQLLMLVFPRRAAADPSPATGSPPDHPPV